MATNQYETVFITEPEVSNEHLDQLLEKIKQIVSNHKGAVGAEDRWGRRRLAFPIQGHREGVYTVMGFSAEPTVVTDLEHLYNVTDSVIRHLVIRQIKKNKKFAPRRERSASAMDSARPTRPGSGPRHRTHSPTPAAASAPASAAAPVSTPTPTPTPTPTEPGKATE